MQCPACQHSNDKVLESRTIQNGSVIRRRRECLNCQFRYTTYEKIESQPLLVLKKNGTKQPFSKEKLMKGLQRAFEKRPIAFNEIKEVAETIEENIRANYNFEIPSHEVGRITLDTIYSVDQVAYLRFASVYQTFNSIEEFKNLVNKLQNKNHQPYSQKEGFEQIF